MNRTIFFFLNYSKYEPGKQKFFSEPRLSRPMLFGKETKYRVNGRLLARSEAADATSPRPRRFIGLKPWRGSRWRESCRNKLDNAPRGIGTRTGVRSPDLWFFHYYFARSALYYVDARINFDSCDLAPNGFPPAKRRKIDVRFSGFHNDVFARNRLRRDSANSAPSTSNAVPHQLEFVSYQNRYDTSIQNTTNQRLRAYLPHEHFGNEKNPSLLPKFFFTLHFLNVRPFRLWALFARFM